MGLLVLFADCAFIGILPAHQRTVKNNTIVVILCCLVESKVGSVPRCWDLGVWKAGLGTSSGWKNITRHELYS